MSGWIIQEVSACFDDTRRPSLDAAAALSHTSDRTLQVIAVACIDLAMPKDVEMHGASQEWSPMTRLQPDVVVVTRFIPAQLTIYCEI